MEPQFERLKALVQRLRGEGGCPWDRKQTHRSLQPYLLEETYEVLEAIDRGDLQRLKEELGDLLLQITMQAQIASEEGHFDIDGVAEDICQKLIRRHPHVFGLAKVGGVEEVLHNWEEIKKAEGKESVLGGVPRTLPALLRAYRIQEKASRVGFDWKNLQGVLAKVSEEWEELRARTHSPDREKVEEELGDLLFSLVNLARFLGVNPEDALRRTIDKFTSRFKYVEQGLEEQGKDPNTATLEEMDRLWDEAKGNE